MRSPADVWTSVKLFTDGFLAVAVRLNELQQ